MAIYDHSISIEMINKQKETNPTFETIYLDKNSMHIDGFVFDKLKIYCYLEMTSRRDYHGFVIVIPSITLRNKSVYIIKKIDSKEKFSAKKEHYFSDCMMYFRTKKLYRWNELFETKDNFLNRGIVFDNPWIFQPIERLRKNKLKKIL